MKICSFCGQDRFVIRFDGVLTCLCGHVVSLCNGSIVRFNPFPFCTVCGCNFFGIADNGFLVCGNGHSVTAWNGFQYVRVVI